MDFGASTIALRVGTSRPLLGVVLSTAVLVGGASTSAAQTVRGRLLEAGTDRPVVLAMVALTDTAYEVVEQTLTDHKGGFRLQAPGPGDYFLLADRIGYEPAIDGVLELGEGGFIEITFYLRPRPVELEGITATAERQRTEEKLDLAGFYDRRDAGFGDFITPEELERLRPADTRDLLQRIPNVHVGSGFAGQGVRCNGAAPRVYLDGIEVRSGNSLTGGFVLEDVADVESIAGVEVYRRASALPLQYGATYEAGAPAGLMTCTILIWTKG